MLHNKIIEENYNKLNDRLKYFIMQKVNDELTAEDILHDVFLKVHKSIDSLKDDSKLTSWIYQITRNAITDYYRTREITEDISSLNYSAEKVADDDAVKRIQPAVKRMLLSLPEKYRDALVETEYNGLTQSALAEKLNLSLPAIKSRVQRARKMLKEILLECCHFDFDKFGTIIDFYPHCCNECSSCEASC